MASIPHTDAGDALAYLGPHQQSDPGKSQDNTPSLERSDAVILGQDMGKQDGENRGGCLKECRPATGDVLLTPRDQAKGKCAVEQSHDGVGSPQSPPPREGHFSCSEQEPDQE